MKEKIIEIHNQIGQEESPNSLHWWILLPIRLILYFFSLIYKFIIATRNRLFDWKILQSNSYDIPIICIGNLSVGGTGKTPHTEYLIRLLKGDYHVAVVSRGYKRKTKGFILANSQSTAREIGDEPFQIKQKFPECTVAVAEKRKNGIEQLLQKDEPQIDTILLDDAYQHRQVKAGLNILLTEYHHLFCDDYLLPLGHLRESIHGKERAHIVIVTKCPEEILPIDYNIITKKLNLRPFQQLYFTTFTYGQPYPLYTDKIKHILKLSELKKEDAILVVSGIANPKPLLLELKKYTPKVHCISFDDHHSFNEKDLVLIQEGFESMPGNKRFIVTTEKDASRLIDLPFLNEELKQHIHVIPIQVSFLQNLQNKFNQNIANYVRENSRNSSIS